MRKKQIFLFASMFLLLLSSCNTYRVTMNDPYGRYKVINPKWTIKTDQPNPQNLIQYDCLYIYKNPHQNIYSYQVLRFWPTGQVMQKYLTSDEFKDLDAQMGTFYHAYCDYYIIDGRNFTIEAFNSMYHTFRKGYIDEHGNLIMTESHLAGRQLPKWPEPAVFMKTKANLQPLVPDW